MRIVITGGAGFIGSHLAAHWCERAEVCVLDNLKTGRRENLEGLPVHWVQGDVRDQPVVRQVMEGAEIVFHLAAMVSVPESVVFPKECVENNTLGTLNVLEAARQTGSRVVFASSAAVYGNNPVVPKTETLPPEPGSPYAITKLEGEYFLDFHHRQFGLSCSSLRFFNVFGPRQNPCGPYASAVPVFITQALKHEPIRIFGDGTQTRDFIYVKDIVSALSFLGSETGLTGVFNAGCGRSTAIDPLAREIIRKTRSRSRIEFLPERAGDVKHSSASAEKLLTLGWQPEWTLEDALEETIRSYQ